MSGSSCGSRGRIIISAVDDKGRLHVFLFPNRCPKRKIRSVEKIVVSVKDKKERIIVLVSYAEHVLKVRLYYSDFIMIVSGHDEDIKKCCTRIVRNAMNRSEEGIISALRDLVVKGIKYCSVLTTAETIPDGDYKPVDDYLSVFICLFEQIWNIIRTAEDLITVMYGLFSVTFTETSIRGIDILAKRGFPVRLSEPRLCLFAYYSPLLASDYTRT